MDLSSLVEQLANHDDPTALASLTGALAADPTIVAAHTDLGNTLLHEACRAAHLEAARALLDAGADVNARGDHGWRPLHCAVHDRGGAKAAPIVRLLMANGADPNLEDDNGFTPVDWAKQELWDRADEVLATMNAGATKPAGAAKPVGNTKTGPRAVKAPSTKPATARVIDFASRAKVHPTDFAATQATIRAIERRSHTELALFRMLEAFGRDEPNDRAAATSGLPAADTSRLAELERVLEVLGSTSWAAASRAWIRDDLKPGHLRRFFAHDPAGEEDA